MESNSTSLSPQDAMIRPIKVRLHPFLNQVSGSTLMFEFNDRIICKPLLTAEYSFYSSLPDRMVRFTAEFKGTSDPYIAVFAAGYDATSIPDMWY